MKFFPKTLNVENKNNFLKLKYGRCNCYLRRAIYEHIISHEEKDYFSIEEFNESKVHDMKMSQKLIDEIVPELIELGWKCKKAYGNGGLFIYSTEKPPKNCYEEGLD